MPINDYDTSGRLERVLAFSNQNKSLFALFPNGSIPANSNPAARTEVTVDGFDLPILAYDASTNESRSWMLQMPRQYEGGSIVVAAVCSMASATSGDVDLDGSWLNLSTSGTSGTFGSAVSTDNTTVPGTAGNLFTVETTFTNAEAGTLAAKQFAMFRLLRDASSDTATGDMQLHAIMGWEA